MEPPATLETPSASSEDTDTPADEAADTVSTATTPNDDLLLTRPLIKAFLVNIPDSVYFKDRESRFIAVSRSTAIRHGFTPEAIIGTTDFDSFADKHALWARADEESIMNTGTPIIGQLEQETWPDGRVTWCLTTKFPLRDERGAIIGTFGISKDVTAAKKTEEALDKTRKELIETSRLAGMAEVATGVLHNVGNVLVSVNVATDLLADTLRNSKAANLAKVVEMLHAHAHDLGDYLANDPKGRRVPEYLASLAAHQAEERESLLKEVEGLRKHIGHIKDIVTMQQAYAKMAGVVEPLEAVELMEDAVRMNAAALVRHDVRLERDFQTVPRVVVEKGKVLQILVNLIRNAKYACDDSGRTEKILTLRIGHGAPGFVNLVIEDNGIGIPPENLAKIFQHGFTTRTDGHGFGLHSSILAASEMGGALKVHSDGTGRGAIFTVALPVEETIGL
jgi:PAS domain S-box-containing protein